MAEAEGDESGSNTSWKLGSSPPKAQPCRLHKPQPQSIRCPECGSTRLNKDGVRYLKDGSSVQRYLCKDCGFRFSWPRSGKQPKRQNLKSGHGLTLDECSSRALALLEQRLERAMSKVEESEKRAAGATEQIADIKGKIVSFLWWMEKQGYAKETIRLAGSALRALLQRGADLLNSESVKEVLAKEKTWSSSRRRNVINVYTLFLKFNGQQWEKPRCGITRKIPFIPTEQEIDDLIAGSPRQVATFLQLLKETAMRSGEAKRLLWTDIDFERRLIILNEPEKNSLPRIWHVSAKLINMLNALPRKSLRVFGDGPINSIKSTFIKARRRLAFKLQNPRLLQIHFHTIRHWKATMEYHRTNDILHVKELLGHKKLDNVAIYVQIDKKLFADTDDSFICKVAHNVGEAVALVEAGFEYVTGEYEDGGKIFRKRK